ncbi:MAG: secretin and TonB N-terminal domain-containing protein [Deltaproteobacteria bacterium]
MTRRIFVFWVMMAVAGTMGGMRVWAQTPDTGEEGTQAVQTPAMPDEGGAPAAGAQPQTEESAGVTTGKETITLDFKEADIRDVLKVIAYKSGVNIVASPEVAGTVNVRITDVPWEKALDVILKSYGYAYDKQDNIIMVAPLEKLTAQRKMEQDLAQVQPTVTEIVNLRYIDAGDAKKAIEPQLSPRGRVTILEVTGQAGWGFGGAFSEKRNRTGQTTSRSRTIIVSDIPPVLDKIREVLKKIDVKPKQVLIETRIVEVSRDKLKDYGIDYATGDTGAESTTVTMQGINDELAAGGHVFGGLGVDPAAFGPKATTIDVTNTGLGLIFQKLSGTRFEVILHALEENVASNILSAPSILTLDNQEATILVGEQFPIVSTTKSSDTASTVDVSLDSYIDIGIQLNVVPQVSGIDRDYINMIIHPAVTSEGTLIENRYPRITTRETQTQILMRTGETIMIGGLMKDVKNESIQGVPFLRRIPWLGKIFFERTTIDTEKIELVIFITAHVVNDEGLTSDQLEILEKNLGLRSSGSK